MEYFDYSLSLFKKIEKTDFSELSNTSENPIRALIPFVLKNFSFEKFKELYRKETDRIIDEYLPIEKSDTEQIEKLKAIYYYDNSVNNYSWMFLFWIWNNKIEIEEADLKLLLRAEFMGMMGYRLIDLYTDDEGTNKEYFFIGNFLIRSFEQIFNDVFKTKKTFDLINYYTLKYNEIEYIEKRNLWKTCPYSWKKSFELGFKTSPLLSLFHVVFSASNSEENKSTDLLKALLNALAANQILDDISDAPSDLAVGRETLVMSGFFSKYGIENSWNDKNIKDFLNQERLVMIYKNLLELFEEALNLAEKHEDLIFMLFIEFGKQGFLNNFEVVPIK
ncbi:MAG: hypothetical protein KDC52_19340 [Ignavibacteriae bacterium]|nr:hypothetical protein [Ignavibacteriota bacterium]